MSSRSPLFSDLTASFVLFLIAIPLNLGIALASGATAVQGLAAGVIGGLVVGLLAGCPLMVSGPATGLIAIVWQITDEHGMVMLGPVVLAAGLLQILIGLAGLGPWFRAVAPAVIQGMLAGIGILIFASQFHVMLGQRPEKVGLTNLLMIPGALYHGHFHPALLGALTILVILVWNRIPGRAKLIPGALPGVGAAILVTWASGFKVAMVEVPVDLASEFRLTSLEQLRHLSDLPVLESVLALAFIATAQTLLTATAVDRLHDRERTNYNREVVAQGVGNLLAGWLGLLPLCGVIVRSAANLQAGAVSRRATVLQGVWVALFAFCLAPALRYIPVAALAAVLVLTGIRLVNLDAVRELSQFGRGELVTYWGTLVTVVSVDLLSGIAVGFALSAVRLVHNLTNCQTRVYKDTDSGATVVEVKGSATFFTLPELARVLEEVPPGREVHVFVSHLYYIDHACLEHIMTWEEQYISQGGQVFIEWDHLIGRFKKPTTSTNDVLEQVSRATAYETLVAQAPVLDRESYSSHQELVDEICQLMQRRQPRVKPARLATRLIYELQLGGSPFVAGSGLPNLRVNELQRQHLILVRVRRGITFIHPVSGQGHTAFCLLFLFSPEEAAGEHIRTLASLISRAEEDCLTEWLEARSDEELRQTFLKHRRFVSVVLKSQAATAVLLDRAVWQVAELLPPSALIALVEREGESLVPKGKTILREGDRLIIFGEDHDIDLLFRRYVNNEPSLRSPRGFGIVDASRRKSGAASPQGGPARPGQGREKKEEWP
ncbi:MAG: SulP family inorganic anion transporter [Vulcanimicrobiota bacterium]